jgi:K+-sensing histidine kinase KdpD
MPDHRRAAMNTTFTPRWRQWGAAGLVLLLCTGVSAALEPHFDQANIILVYMAGTVYVAQRHGRTAALAVVAGSVLIFDCIFVAPRWSFTPIDPQYYFTFFVMAGVGWLIAHLAERARRESAAAAAAAVAVESERMRNTLLSAISHDFRTPLTTIVGSATSLLQQGHAIDEAQRRALLEGLLGEAQRLHTLSSDLLDLTRMQEGAVQPQCEWCPADELAEEALQATAQRLSRHPVTVDIDPPDLAVWGDPRLLGQAAVNLLDNLARHTPAGTAATLRIAARSAGHWTLTLSDSGPGWPAGRPLPAFEHSGAAGGEGRSQAGLGLAICAAVARLHRGRLDAGRAGAAGGASVTLTLPQPADLPMLGPDGTPAER